MCGRAYVTYTDEELEMRYRNKRPIPLPKFDTTYNLAPSQNSVVVTEDEAGNRHFKLFRWGLVPYWSKDAKVGYKMINAKAETIAEKPSFRAAFKQRRCIVPFSGFFEWRQDPDGKKAFCIRPHASATGSSILSLAGIWEHWRNPEPFATPGPKGAPPLNEIYSFSIITTEANALMQQVHDRMPVILAPKDEEAWLNPNTKDQTQLKALLKPCPPDWLEAYEISSLVNSPKNNTKEILNQIRK